MKRIFAVLLVVLAIAVSGCASMKMTSDMSKAQNAELVVTDIETSLAVAEGVYPALLASVETEKAVEIKAKVEPALTVSRHTVAVARGAVEAWKATGESVDVQDWATIRGAAAKAVGELVVMVAELRAKYGA